MSYRHVFFLISFHFNHYISNVLTFYEIQREKKEKNSILVLDTTYDESTVVSESKANE